MNLYETRAHDEDGRERLLYSGQDSGLAAKIGEAADPTYPDVWLKEDGIKISDIRGYKSNA